MRALLTIIIVTATAWAGYWFVGSNAVERGLAKWLSDRERAGWEVEYSDLTTRGFPNRFDTTLSDLKLSDPRIGVEWAAPFFQILALSYKPNHIIAVWPETQTITTPSDLITVTNSNMRGSVVFKPDTSLALERSSFELKNFALQSNAGWAARLEDGTFATRQTIGAPKSHEVYFDAKNVTPSAADVHKLDPLGVMPGMIGTLTFDAMAEFDAPWDRFAIENRRPQLTALNIRQFLAVWGDVELRATGSLTVDLGGLPSGKISVNARNWQKLLDIAVAANVISTELKPTIENMLRVLSGLSGSPEAIEVPLTFQDGLVKIGPVPLGKSPVLRLR